MARSAKTRTQEGTPSKKGTPEADAPRSDLVPPEVRADAEPVRVADPPPEPEPEATDEAPAPEFAAVAPPPPAESPRTQTPPPAPVTVQKVGFTPLVLGGAVAAALGFGVAWYLQGEDRGELESVVSAQAGRIAELEAAIAALPEVPDLAPLQATVAEVETALGTAQGRVDALSEEVGGFDARLTAVERAPGADGTLAETAIASWERELDGLREQIAAQQARMQEIADAARAELEATRAEAASVEEDAQAAAQRAIARAALARIQAALDSGEPFEAALSDLLGAATAEVPDVLSAAAAEGVPTIAALRDTFPAAARAALATARAEGLAGEEGGAVAAFLRSQLEVRSVAPREGDDPDAILSRAEAALGENRLIDALAEIDSLPEVVRAALSDWLAPAAARAEALAAVEALSQSLNEN